MGNLSGVLQGTLWIPLLYFFWKVEGEDHGDQTCVTMTLWVGNAKNAKGKYRRTMESVSARYQQTEKATRRFAQEELLINELGRIKRTKNAPISISISMSMLQLLMQ